MTLLIKKDTPSMKNSIMLQWKFKEIITPYPFPPPPNLHLNQTIRIFSRTIWRFREVMTTYTNYGISVNKYFSVKVQNRLQKLYDRASITYVSYPYANLKGPVKKIHTKNKKEKKIQHSYNSSQWKNKMHATCNIPAFF